MNRIYIPIIAILLTAVIVAIMQFSIPAEVQAEVDNRSTENQYYTQLTAKIDNMATSNWDTLQLMSIEADLRSKKKLGLIPADIAESLQAQLYGEYLRVLTREANQLADSAYTTDSIMGIYNEIARMHAISEYEQTTKDVYERYTKLFSFDYIHQQIDSFIRNEKYSVDKHDSIVSELNKAREDESIKNIPLVALNVPLHIKNLADFAEFDYKFMGAYFGGSLVDCGTLIRIFEDSFDYPNKYMYYLINYTRCYP